MSCHQILGGGWSTAGDKQQQWWRNTDAASIFHSPTTPGKEFLPLSFTLHYTTFWCLMKSKLQFTTDLDPCMMRSMRWEPGMFPTNCSSARLRIFWQFNKDGVFTCQCCILQFGLDCLLHMLMDCLWNPWATEKCTLKGSCTLWYFVFWDGLDEPTFMA